MRRSLLRLAAPTLAVLTLGLWIAPSSWAQESATQRLRGQITRVDGDMIYLRGSNGQPVAVLLAPDASVTSVTPAHLTDIKPGRFVGTAARPEAGGRWQAIEVHLFPEGSRLGEGHRPWAPEPGATMTNADVAAAAVKASDGKMTLSTGGQTYEFDVPKGTPIVAMDPGTRALLKKGAHVVVNQAQPGAGGSYSTKNIVVTTALNWPPK
ncbi:MAG TPA: hypothetical protein VGF92_20490 [Stellaceae bacterium]|jgi:hypothetical protein